MTKKYKIKEFGKDYWGNKKYTVTESSDSDSSAIAFLILALAILLLPTGLLYLVVFLIYPKMFPYKENSERNFYFSHWQFCVVKNSLYITFFISIFVYVYRYYLVYSELQEQEDFNRAVVDIVVYSLLGLLSYIYAVVLLCRDTYWKKFYNQEP